MAKRKRLTPAQVVRADTDNPDQNAHTSVPPIAQVASHAATTAALAEVSREMQTARQEGRLIRQLPLDGVVADHLVRDRIMSDHALPTEDEDMAALIASLRARGQQTPIEVMEAGKDRFGLISGWRRLRALYHLFAETGDARFGHVLALVRTPQDASDAYVAMVEENEIRAGLSHYERARIVLRSVGAGGFADERTALRTLFASASRAKRSKIKSFAEVVRACDADLRFPTHLGERLGLEMAARLTDDTGFAAHLSKALKADAPTDPGAEARIIRMVLDKTAPVKDVSRAKQAAGGQAGTPPTEKELIPGVRLQHSPSRLILSGPGVDAQLHRALADWLRARGC